MTKMIIGLLAVVLGVTGSVLTAAPKKKQSLSATGVIYVKLPGDGYRAIGADDYNPYNCNTQTYTCAYYVTPSGTNTVTAQYYTNIEMSNFAYGYDAKVKFVPTMANEAWVGVYEEPIFE